MKENFPFSMQRMNRRHFLQTAALLAAGAVLPPDTIQSVENMERVHFAPNQLGVNINTKNIHWFHGKEKEREIVQALMDLSVDHVRIPLPFDEVMAHPDKPSFETTDWIIEMAMRKGKKIHLQMGLKTINSPEFHLPDWFVKRFPEVTQTHFQIGSSPERDVIIEHYLIACCERYLTKKTKDAVASIHIENEAFSQNLSVTNRSIHEELQKKEAAVVRRFAPDIPFVQNIPWDTPWKIAQVYSQNDVLGFNAYNQAAWQNAFAKTALWAVAKTARFFAEKLNKQFHFTEYQAGAWLSGNKKPNYPYAFEEFKEGLRQIYYIQPDLTFLWAMELHLGKERDKHVDYLYEITQAT